MLASEMVWQVRAHHLKDWGALTTALEYGISADSTELSLVNMADTLTEDRVIICETESMRIVTVGVNLTVERGIMGTSAQAHSAGAMVIYEPRFTNTDILRALNEALSVLNGYEPLVKVTPDGEYNAVSGVYEYEAPDDAIDIVKVEVERASGVYVPFYSYRVLNEYTPPRIRVWPGAPYAGAGLRIVYTANHKPLTWTAAVDVDSKWHDFMTTYAAGLLIENEEAYLSAQTTQASGTLPRVGAQQQIGRMMQSRALGLLQARRPASRVVMRPDQRLYRR